MPHFVIDCSQSILHAQAEEQLVDRVHRAANCTRLFDERDIKVRVNPYTTYSVGNKREPFIHVFASIMEGRSIEEKAGLSKLIVSELSSMFPQVRSIAINVAEFERATYCNREML
ncbi:MAG: 5-carboxymethyl-2-hydroxymuconate isomerase [Lysobacteraceae bacterium]|nr:MAG: 5-carboxymethyl-2-hydroxymuconate isomerase [Xanthomonadaceae bacterium]